ncbi:sensor histidine kinase [Priestia taiwanensis]|uniref:Sensor histidine kinase n=1 Tax=Priestia taiwanensis TaxID=1347902 RepID=A0A917AUP7_9BACI|nr:sensor histidine kinase [Priestia taiwanensis]MBM7363405.1 NarL family two-component system sensor histidine kinase LiaS [Priestia taiwanensis]GGE77433.1 sensor histidine kinase [Priestia taiwanensis]
MKKTNIQILYMKYSTLAFLLLSALISFLYIWYSEELSYTFLFKTDVASIPLALFILILSIAFGICTGYIGGYVIKKRLRELDTSLLQIERGQFTLPENDVLDDFTNIEQRFHALASSLEEQALSFQKITNERANETEKELENAVSKERNRLARELHDSVSQQLFAISMMISAINEMPNTNKQPFERQLQLIEEMAVNAQSEMRALLLHLRPVQLEGRKLKDAIHDLLTELSAKQSITIKWYIDDTISLEKGVEDHLFRIVQEALSNTLRHAQAKNIELRLRPIEKGILLKVIDDGVGFDLNKPKAGSYGLQSMRERTNEIGGTFKLVSLLKKGTQLEVKIPVAEGGI